MADKIFLVIGGDLRQCFLCNKLIDFGTVYSFGLNKKELKKEIIALNSLSEFKEKADFLVLPIPVTNDEVNVNLIGIEEKLSIYSLIPLLKLNAVIFGGKFGKEASIFTYKGFEVVDYLEREELSVMNSIPTGEGAIMLALEEMSTTLYNSKVVITGFGRISKVLVKYLTAFGAKVVVVARKYDQLEWAKFYGCEGLLYSQMEKAVKNADLIFNTVPARIFTREHFELIKKDCLMIDLASKPGGLDFEQAKNYGVKAIWALSLPGKVAPVTAGEMIANTIVNILAERGEV